MCNKKQVVGIYFRNTCKHANELNMRFKRERQRERDRESERERERERERETERERQKGGRIGERASVISDS